MFIQLFFSFGMNFIHRNAYHTIPHINCLEKCMSHIFRTISKMVEKRYRIVSAAV